MASRIAFGSVLSLLCTIALFGGASAQQTPAWSDIDCAQSKIITPPGLKCRATQEYAGGTGYWSAGPGGTFRRWTTEGTLNGHKFFYHANEVTSLGSSIMEAKSLQEGLKEMTREARGGSSFSQLGDRGGVDYITFVGADGESCVGIRKYGPSVRAGYQWILNAMRCSPTGKPVPQVEIDRFIAAAGFRG